MPSRDESGDRLPSAVEVSASEVKKAWHHYVDRVWQTRETFVVTRYGRPVARLGPLGGDELSTGSASLVGALRGTVTFHEDVVAPLDETWAAADPGSEAGDG